MNTNQRAGEAPTRSAADDPRPRAKAAGHSLSDQAAEAVDGVTREARSVAAEAGQAAEAQAEKVKAAAASHLEAFADAMRSASDELGKKQGGPAAELVSHAASGLETLSRSIDGRSTSEMVDAVRRFGRENPLGFVAGSILAGFALGRFASVATDTHRGAGAMPRAEPGASVREDGR